MMRKQVVYFYEGETEKKLLEVLKNTQRIRSGKLKKFNLWKNDFKSIKKTIHTATELFFIVDTDDTDNTKIFESNIKSFDNPFNLIIQVKNLEDELCYSCNKSNNKELFQDFYKVQHSDTFKSKFIKDKNLFNVLDKNNFDFLKLWENSKNFTEFLDKNFIKVDINCKYRT